MNALKFNSAKNATNFAPKVNAAAPSFLGNLFGSYITLALTVILLILVFVAIYVYFKTIGYTVDLGFDKLMDVFKSKEEVSVTLTEDGNKEASTKFQPPIPDITEGPETKKLKELLGIDPPKPQGPVDVGFPPPPAAAPMPFTPEERPSGMPGAKEPPGFVTKTLNKLDSIKNPKKKKEVFNVSRNLYTYEEAAPLCKAMGAELATYEQVSDAQKGGADWCNYGWTKGQMAVYPTSENTWNKLQTGDARFRNSCGKPGMNGGFFDNPELRFGVNCFGARPIKKDSDELLVDSELIVPPTADQIEFDKKVEKFRDNIGNVNILPFNRDKWSNKK
jgi:hypothetical protein